MINTVTGQISTKGIGRVLMHEHIICASNDMLKSLGDKWLNLEKVGTFASDILLEIKKKCAISLYVDATPNDVGRDLSLLKNVSIKTGLPIVASSGMYWYKSCFTYTRTAEEIAWIFLEECANGIEGTDVKPGILKCASDREGITDDNYKRLCAMGITQAKTNLPLYVHCSHDGNLANEQLDVLFSQGASPDRIAIGHVNCRPDVDYLEAILKRGVYIAFDQCRTTDVFPEVVSELCKRGFADKILLSNDYPIHQDFARPMNTGLSVPRDVHIENLSFMTEKLIPAFVDAGIDEQVCENMMCQNAVKFMDM